MIKEHLLPIGKPNLDERWDNTIYTPTSELSHSRLVALGRFPLNVTILTMVLVRAIPGTALPHCRSMACSTDSLHGEGHHPSELLVSFCLWCMVPGSGKMYPHLKIRGGNNGSLYFTGFAFTIKNGV